MILRRRQFADIEVHEPAETARRNAARMTERARSEGYATAGSDPLGATERLRHILVLIETGVFIGSPSPRRLLQLASLLLEANADTNDLDEACRLARHAYELAQACGQSDLIDQAARLVGRRLQLVRIGREVGVRATRARRRCAGCLTGRVPEQQVGAVGADPGRELSVE